MRVYQAMARAIVDEGVRSVFTLVGQANMHLVSALDADDRVSVYHALHEGAALGMAEGCRRSSGRPVVCTVTGGAALVNQALSLVEAVRSRTPLVIITGRTPAAYRGSPQTFDHRLLAVTTGAGYEEITDAAHTLLMTRAAFMRAEAESRPVVLDVASDLQQAEFGDEYAYRPATGSRPALPAPEAPRESLQEAASKIAAARRPVIIAGAGAVASGARDAVIALGDRAGALLATTLPAHGWFADHPYDIGIAGMFAWPHAIDLIREADCVIGIGASLNRYTMQDIATRALSFDASRVVQITLDEPQPLGDDRYAAVSIRGDARAAAETLLSLLPAAASGYRTEHVTALVQRGREDSDPERFEAEEGRADPRELCQLLDRELPSACGVTIATGHCWSFPIMHLTRWRTPQLFTYHFGSIGVATAIGIGGSIGAPDRPMVIVEGDGSVLMNVHNLQVMARYRLPILLVVLNDEAYGAELHQLRGQGLDTTISELVPTDIAALGAAFGCASRTIRETDEFTVAVKDFLADPRPVVLDCRISANVISVPSRRLDYRSAREVP